MVDDKRVDPYDPKNMPEPWTIGGVDRSDKVDRISIQNAVETPFWMAVWAAEPERLIDVRMTYSGLKVICDMIDLRMNMVKQEEITGRTNAEAVKGYVRLVRDRLEKLPSAQPEIIRCKDCKHYDGRPCGIVDWYNTADDFCSRAERRTDD